MVLATLHEAAHEIGMRFPLTLGARGSCTIGGLTSTNAGGTQVLKFGTMRALVAGVEAVLPDGIDPQRPVRPQEGQSRLQPRPAADRRRGHARRGHRRRAAAGPGGRGARRRLGRCRKPDARRSTCCASSRRAPHSIEGFELVPAGFARAGAQAHPRHARRRLPASTPGTRWSKRPRPTPMRTSSAELERLLGAALEQGIIGDAVIAANEAQAEAFWKIRDSISEAERAEGPDARARHLRAGRRHAALHRRRRSRGRTRLPGRDRQRLRPSRRRQHPLPRPRRRPRGARIGTSAKARRSRAWSTIWSPPPAARSPPSTASAS